MHIAIIGNGISGVTAARHLRKLSDHKITLISAETDHFFSRTALMYIYMGHMRYEDTKPYEDWFWAKNRIDLLKDYVTSIDTKNKKLNLQISESLDYDALIIATGSKPNKFGWPGQDLAGVQGMYSYQDLESMEAASQKGIHQAVIVGGGLIGIEMAEMFHSRHIPVTFLVREKSYWNNVLPPKESEMINREIKRNGIDLRLATELHSIQDDGNGHAKSIITNKEETIQCNFVGLTAGVHPNIHFIKDDETNGIECARGILVDEYLQTNIPDVYAIGDCAQMINPSAGRRPIEAIWYTGRMMGETVAYNICGHEVPYEPRLWFNSAKFFDIEYQVYGDVRAQQPAHHSSVYWEHSSGLKSIRIVYETDSSKVVGFNLMGIRYRHEVCEKWILDETSIETVLQNLGMANFDPEFFKQYEKDIIQIYNKQTGSQLQLKKRRGLKSVISFLKGN